MRIKSNARIEIGRLFSCLEYGERIAQDCALRQASMRATHSSHFFLRQARQEQHHAKVFHRVILCVTPRGPKQVPATLKRFRARIERACRRHDLVETLVGQQIVLEGFGGLILEKLDRKFDQRKLGFRRVRKILLHQERGHQAFGHRMIDELIASNVAPVEHIRSLGLEYLALVECVMDDLQSIFDVVGADADQYKKELRSNLPVWLKP
ncbi:MAG: hypothetical protein QNI91_18740 [Arenicellales bacterium]|nr:hypothetical protein [Arenicellales bacterium]